METKSRRQFRVLFIGVRENDKELHMTDVGESDSEGALYSTERMGSHRN